MADPANERSEERVVSWLLRGGLILSSIMMAVGLVLALARARLQQHPVSFRTLGHYLAGGHPSGLMALGLFVLVALPVARVLVLVVQFARERDWRFAAVGSAVFGMLVLAVFLGRS